MFKEEITEYTTMSNHMTNNSNALNELNSLNENFETRFKMQDVDQISARATVCEIKNSWDQPYIL